MTQFYKAQNMFTFINKLFKKISNLGKYYICDQKIKVDFPLSLLLVFPWSNYLFFKTL